MRLALIGGEEFSDGFEDAHARLAAELLARKPNGRALRVAFLPTCAADDGPAAIEHWCRRAAARLSWDGVQVRGLPIVDRRGAAEAELIAWIETADWIYFGGGYPHVGMRILAGTPALEAVRSAAQRGALISGASGGAMLLCSRSWIVTGEFEAAIGALPGGAESEIRMPDPEFIDCVGLLPMTLCWPHMNVGFSFAWLRTGAQSPGHTLIGLDEQTMVLNLDGAWEAFGRGRVRIVDPGHTAHDFVHGQSIPEHLLWSA